LYYYFYFLPGAPEGRGLARVLDWEVPAFGNPLEDVGLDLPPKLALDCR
jgi:hypothetical protein